jgi:hypothetical protein
MEISLRSYHGGRDANMRQQMIKDNYNHQLQNATASLPTQADALTPGFWEFFNSLFHHIYIYIYIYI